MLKPRYAALQLYLAGALALPLAANADDYRAEVRLSFDRTLFDADGVPDADALGVTGLYYLEPVPTDGVPLAEAAFLNRSSWAGVAAVRSEFGDAKLDVFGVAFGYYVPDTIFYGRLGFTYLDDFPGDRSTFNGTFGITPFDGLRLTTEFDENGWDPNVTARYVGKIRGSHFYAASITAVDPDEDDVDVRLNFDYYLDHTFSIGAGVSSDAWTLRAEKFFTPSFAVGARAFTGSDDDGDGFGAHVTWRF